MKRCLFLVGMMLSSVLRAADSAPLPSLSLDAAYQDLQKAVERADHPLAYKLAMQGACRNDARAQRMLSRLLFFGHGGAINRAASYAWAAMSARETGNAVENALAGIKRSISAAELQNGEELFVCLDRAINQRSTGVSCKMTGLVAERFPVIECVQVELQVRRDEPACASWCNSE